VTSWDDATGYQKGASASQSVSVKVQSRGRAETPVASEASSSEIGTKDVEVAMNHYERGQPSRSTLTRYASFTNRIAAEFIQ
jgi:hypothetical protein